ncbi:aldehyde dehydrogenase family protein [Aestuariispira insulae]|uniref:Acyl-CoA reductase-like NAD-dependent aldehyde dehydrogenase n=1 Tax=Aestuariispira insulae TaxID=1461337 RepID=A0A3D9HHS2_9PROT|nr:aldehyde dehydrogenase family protein [Aestuariispira insulae]RED49059.1 acyl-CoA reductase-like NAD-dependent aldehyde dehydrogenase [Aestuariispira insulae]
MSTILKCISPVDGSVYLERETASSEAIDAALAKANAAQKDWARKTVAERAKICTAFVEAFQGEADRHAEELAWQMGRPIRYGKGEVGGLVERATYMISVAEEALRDVQVGEKDGFTRYIKREPVGVVFTIAPWNFPYMTAVNSVIPALMAGNAVILKHATQTLGCAERFADAFAAAGLPDGLFQALHLSHQDAADIIGSGQVNYVSFTGSVRGGSEIEKAASGHFLGTGLELGGKDPAYVRADADIDQAVDGLVDGAMFNSGQSCCGIERIYVHESVYDAFVDGAAKLVSGYKLGSPLDEETTLGPVVNAKAANFVRQQIKDAVAAGARALVSVADFPADDGEGSYLAPQVLVDVDHSMSVMTEESFGPVVGIMKVSSDEEAVALMNDSEFGLTASIWTKDLAKAVELGDQINTGTFFMNRCDYLDPALAWTGVKNTGRGCSLSKLGYEALTRPKSYHLKHA